MDADEAIERAVALATTLGGDGGGDDVDCAWWGSYWRTVKHARTEAASEAAALYQAAVVAGTAARATSDGTTLLRSDADARKAGRHDEGRRQGLVTAAARQRVVRFHGVARAVKGAKDVRVLFGESEEIAAGAGGVDAVRCSPDPAQCVPSGGGRGRVPTRVRTSRPSCGMRRLAVWEAGKGIHNERTLKLVVKVGRRRCA